MERTPLREEFFRLAHEDPYLAMIRKMYVRAWAEGYRRALDDVMDDILLDQWNNLTGAMVRLCWNLFCVVCFRP